MILPIRIYGDPVLRAETQEVLEPSAELDALVEDMKVTMHAASGIGLAAPQVGRTERLFLVDLTPVLEDLEPEEREEYPPQPMVFVNPAIVWCNSDEVEFEEGCLSIPEIREDVLRPDRIRIMFHDQTLQVHSLEVGGILARVIQHEYDHLEGVLFIDRITAFRRTMLRRRLREISRGDLEADYSVAVYQRAPAAT